VKEELRARLETAAAVGFRSINAEIVHRLEQTFIAEFLLDGPEMRRIALLMATSFYQGGTQASYSEFEKALPPARWVRDRELYYSAVSAVVDALIAGMPNTNDRERAVLIDLLRARIGIWVKPDPVLEELKKLPDPVLEELKKVMEKGQ
jgi:hypothetical protein